MQYERNLRFRIWWRFISIAHELNVGRSDMSLNIWLWKTIRILGWFASSQSGTLKFHEIVKRGTIRNLRLAVLEISYTWPFVTIWMFLIHGAYNSKLRIEYFNWFISKFLNCHLLWDIKTHHRIALTIFSLQFLVDRCF